MRSSAPANGCPLTRTWPEIPEGSSIAASGCGLSPGCSVMASVRSGEPVRWNVMVYAPGGRLAKPYEPTGELAVRAVRV